MTSVRLDGLDGSNPLGFLAALGTLRVIDDRARQLHKSVPRLSWAEEDAWRPLLHGVRDLDEVVVSVLEDRPLWVKEAALTFAYGKDGTRVDTTTPGAIRDLKPPPAVMRGLLEEVAELAASGDIRSARQVASFGTDIASDNSGNTKPTALHFTAGQQSFLGAIAEVHEALTEEHVREALAGPWTRSSSLKSLGWDPMGAFNARMYALRARDPAPEKRPSVPGAEWLAFVGMSFLPAVPRGAQVLTTCVQGGWRDGVLRWPLWVRPATARTVESLLRMDDIEGMSRSYREKRGIGIVFRAAILRSDQGGYGSFAPSTVAVKPRRS